ncbi:hypothetical protein CEUSTIGMA_g13603.t1 [Chlamydomonas eustigma]|uniref:Uncharacterized protein n=1 Tax=Chlamydomonas eustigma TaxID=1157962 RepID=A0A250XTR3_9CHLO|nr:hypothetical protein CEUSTIGMA_g13603.t1 [Chlamydomonas eustigma]|eukprot:GAX86190.1 hypothetical protein CEUSTIGMA_g13603.t1 [Chlamydomonas eustigma]
MYFCYLDNRHKLDVKLPPAFASSAQRRLQLAMSQLPPPQLARMMWSLSSAGYQPTEPQLRAYAQKVQVALPSMCLVDLTASVEAFDKWDYKLPETMLSDVMEVSFKLMIQPQQGEEVGAAVKEAVARAVASTEEELVGKDATAVESSTTEGLLAADGGAANVLEPRSTVNIVPQRLEAQGLVQLVRSLLSVGGTPSQDWLYAWSGLLNAEAVQSLRMAGHVSVLQLLDLLALERFEKVKPSVRWVGAFLEALPPVSELEGKYVRCLCQVAARWKSQLLQAKQDNASVLTDLAALPRRVAEKLPAFNSQEAAGLIRDLATLQPDLFSLEESLIEALSDHAEASLCILSPGQQVELVVALSALLFTESNALMEGVSTSSTAKKGPGSKKLSQLYKMLLEGFDAWSFQQVDKEQLLFITELLVSACRRDKRAESQDRLKRASQAVGAAFLGKLKAVNGKDVSRFLMAFSQLPSQLPKNKVGIKYDPILELCLEGIASRMLTGSLRGPEEVSHVAYAVASTGVVPTKQWIADAMRAAQRPPAGSSSSSTLSLEDQQQGLSTEIAKADGASVARLCYAVSAWGADPGKTAAAWLLEAAAAAAAAGSLTPKDAALILLGASQLGVQGLLGSLGSGHVTKEWLQKFSEQALLPLMPRMASRAIATVSTALPAVIGVLSNREEILSSLEQAAGRRLDREEISIQDLEQVAMGLFSAKHRPQKMWLQTALRYAESKPAGAKAKVWLQDLAKL